MNSSGPPIKCECCGLIIHGLRCINDHKGLEHYEENSTDLKVDDNVVATPIPRASNEQDRATEKDILDTDKRLIRAVSLRYPWNGTLPIKKKLSISQIEELWVDVADSLGSTVDNVKKRWQYLGKHFHEIKNERLIYQQSGSAADASKKLSLRHYEGMEHGSESPSIRQVKPPSQSLNDNDCSSISPDSDINCSPGSPSAGSSSAFTPIDAIPSPSSPPRTPTPGGKKRKVDDTNFDLRSALVAKLQQPVRKFDGVDGILARLGEGLRRLPYRDRAVLEIKFLSLLMEAQGKHDLPC